MVRIIDFEPRHAPGVRRLVTCVHEEFGFAHDPRLDADLDGIADAYGGRGGFWVALDGEPVIGTVALRETTGTVAELKRMYLLPRYRGRGIGLALLSRVMEAARQRGFGEVRLDTTLRQTAAIRLYERYGFERVSADGETLYYRLAPS